MYIVVVLVNENSVDVVGEKWFHEHDKGLLMWPDNPRVRRRCLENEERPPEGTPFHPVRILGTYFTLEEARQRAKMAEETSDLFTQDLLGRHTRRPASRRTFRHFTTW
ncbi:unnamed protein product [Dibothriocephalus latus]|uniref:Uncharacterized protein n=1 Tax=Dibothriocephalus latus TaxID=60516 RepID=A0A3P7NE73_DIBLA|nr:unnamed protein product [Dibothriocephalus latus]